MEVFVLNDWEDFRSAQCQHHVDGYWTWAVPEEGVAEGMSVYNVPTASRHCWTVFERRYQETVTGMLCREAWLSGSPQVRGIIVLAVSGSFCSYCKVDLMLPIL